MIELAPHHKVGLPLASPLILASGMIGYGDALSRILDLAVCGAWVTAPVSLRPGQTSPSEPPATRAVEVPGGFVLAEGGDDPGVRQIIRRYGPIWPRLGLPVIVRLRGAADDARDDLTGQALAAQRLAGVAGVAALELAPEAQRGPAAASELIRLVRQASDLPLLVALPLGPDMVAWATASAEAGADALVIAQPPHAAAFAANGALVRGRLYGPAAAPLAWDALAQVAALGLDLPLIGSGGVHRAEDVRAFRQLGAVAVQIDSAVWIDPTCLRRLSTPFA